MSCDLYIHVKHLKKLYCHSIPWVSFHKAIIKHVFQKYLFVVISKVNFSFLFQTFSLNVFSVYVHLTRFMLDSLLFIKVRFKSKFIHRPSCAL